MDREYTIPEELEDIMASADACMNLRDTYAKLPFGYKKARKSAIEGAKLKRQFWSKVYKLYPELINKNLNYRIGTKEITLKEQLCQE